MVITLWTIFFTTLIVFFLILAIRNADDLFPIWMVFMMVCVIFLLIPPMIYYELYEKPYMDLDANDFCVNNGYDRYVNWKGTGVYPKDILYVECIKEDNVTHIIKYNINK